MFQPSTLTEMLERRGLGPERPLLTIADPWKGEQKRTTSELFLRASAIAAELRERGLRPRDRLMLLLPNSLALIETFLGSILAGVVPVMYPPPYTARVVGRYLSQLQRILRQCRPWGAVLDPESLEGAESIPSLDLRLMAPPDPAPDAPRLASLIHPDPGEAALVQYSSGSTGDPKGVVLSHRAVLSQFRSIIETIDPAEDTVTLDWLPHHHDMGLFAGVLFPWHGREQSWQVVNTAPHQFLMDPASWLRNLSRTRATMTGAPNFAFSLCLRYIRDHQLEGVDLSALRFLFCGAEPISRAVVEGFLERFGRYGLEASALLPVYGLAENVLGVSFSARDRRPRFDRILRESLERDGRAVPIDETGITTENEWKDVACVGSPIQGVEVFVVDEFDRALPERHEGEICVRGNSVMTEYLNNPEATERTLRNGWLHTEDRGYLADGQLYVTGRQTDMIIRAGRNLHPQDLEEAAEQVVGTRHGSTVAIGLRDAVDSTDRLVLLCETRVSAADELDELVSRLRMAIVEAFGVPPDRIVLLKPKSLPKTTSGKLQRRLARQLLAEGKLAVLRDAGIA